MHSYFVPRWIAELGHAEIDRLLAAGTLRVYQGHVVPVVGGAEGDEPETEPLFAAVPDDLATLDDEALAALIASYDQAIDDVTASPSDFVSADFTVAQLLDETKAAYATRRALKANQADRVQAAEIDAADVAASFEALAAEAAAEAEAQPSEDEPVVEETAEVEPVVEEAAVEETAAEVTAATRPVPARRMPAPAPARTMRQTRPSEESPVALTAAAGAPDMSPGDRFGSQVEIAEAMMRRHSRFGQTGPGTVEQFGIVRADWREQYSDGRTLDQNIDGNYSKVAALTSPAAIQREFESRRRAQANGAPDALVASGGLCAPVTPYYNLQYISVPDRPVMAALPSFNADRGGLRYARPAALSAVTTAVGIITEAEDAAGGTSATKSCQVIPCPDFQETDVDIIYHCLQFGNLGARTFPELVAQWNNLVLAAHARLAESNLLTNIDAFSTQVTASALGLGASATLFSQILAAADGLRSRNRMNPRAVLRLMLPWWAVDLIISDVIRGQFQRFDTDQARVVALLRTFNIEPSFYIDSANGRQQVFGTQTDGALLPFPSDVVWYLFPEGSFLYLDGGTLELGIVRDSVLNITNDFQIFGESFENVAYVGVESLAVVSTVCDSGTVALPHAVTCPVDYGT